MTTNEKSERVATVHQLIKQGKPEEALGQISEMGHEGVGMMLRTMAESMVRQTMRPSKELVEEVREVSKHDPNAGIIVVFKKDDSLTLEKVSVNEDPDPIATLAQMVKDGGWPIGFTHRRDETAVEIGPFEELENDPWVLAYILLLTNAVRRMNGAPGIPTRPLSVFVEEVLSPGTSKPATAGRLKTSQSEVGFL